MLIYMFYVLPFFCLCIYGLVLPGCSWLPDWSLVFAGAVAQVRAAPPPSLAAGGHAGTPALSFCPKLGGWGWEDRSTPAAACGTLPIAAAR